MKKFASLGLIIVISCWLFPAWGGSGINAFAKAYPLSYFNAIHVDSSVPFNIKVISNTQFNDVTFVGPHAAKFPYKEIVRVEEGILKIKMSQEHKALMEEKPANALVRFSKPAAAAKKQRPTLIIRARSLREIYHAGQGDFIGIHFETPYLDMVINTPGSVHLSGQRVGLRHLTVRGGAKVQLEAVNTPDLVIQLADQSQVKFVGEASLRKLTYRGEGQLSGYWINSPVLHIIGRDQAEAQLAGRVGTLDVRLDHQAKLEARYLRAEHAYVKTFDFAEANVWARNTLSTRPQDQSNIYYYREPGLRSEYMVGSGAVLNMIDTRYISAD